MRDECSALEGAVSLLAELRRRGLTLVLASSSSKDDAQYFLDKLGGEDVVDGYTTKDDVERTKPHPDPIRAALDKAETKAGVMFGDSGWDVEAAKNAGLETVCVLTGGWSEQELRDVGAAAVYDSVPHLIANLDETPFAVE